MEPPENTERRYNTRFRGVPKSFSYSKVGRKAATAAAVIKLKSCSTNKTELHNDFVYTKLTKKSIPVKQSVELSHVELPRVELPCVELTPKNEEESLLKQKKNVELPRVELPCVELPCVELTPKNEEKKPIETEIIPKTEKEEIPPDIPPPVIPTPPIIISNGVHHEKMDISIEVEPCEEMLLEEEKSESDLDAKKEAKSPFHKEITPTLTEFQISQSIDSKTVWITSKEKLSFNGCNVASYNPKTKMFRCVVCQAVGFMSRIGEHYLGTHCNAKVFQCPQCTYCSAWWRCVRNHMSKNHGMPNVPASLWKNQPLLDEIMQLLQNLKYSVDCEDREETVGKRYICTKCPYATDRRDLFNRHENIHREEKPFQCYICFKLFNRADHVKKHFCRIHKDYDYDINLIRRLPSKRSKLPVTPLNGINGSPVHHLESSRFLCNNIDSNLMKPMAPPSQLLNCLTGSPPMMRFNREPPMKIEKESESYNESNSTKPRSNLLSFLMQSDFPPKPPLLEMPSLPRPPESFSGGKCIQDGALASVGFPSAHNNVPKEFICPHCPWQSTDMWALRMHTTTHYTNACVMCSYRSTQESDLEAHMWDCHRKRPCNKCNFLADGIMVLDAHMKEMHSPKHPFTCRICSQFFEIRPDMEAHCIFIHNQVLRECKQEGCDFCSTDPEVLEQHRKEKHESCLLSVKSVENESASTRTLCLYCGCDFADPPSLSLHEELFHENPLQIAGRRPLDPYCCAICGYATPVQVMMMEHMRIHTGQALYCQADEACYFRSPYDTVLREHVLQNHCTDDGIVRCPHCGLRCSTRYSFVTHYEENHHPFCCVLCEEVEHKHFVSDSSSSYLDSTIAALFPFARKVTQPRSSTSDPINKCKVKSDSNQIRSIPKNALIVDTIRRSRKQLQPRKVISGSPRTEEATTSTSASSYCVKRGHQSTVNKATHSNNFISFYAKKVRSLAQASLLRCRFCVKNQLYFRHKRNYVFHVLWHRLKRYRCKQCVHDFDHRYQVLLHTMREHKAQKS